MGVVSTNVPLHQEAVRDILASWMSETLPLWRSGWQCSPSSIALDFWD
jgi:hypothetical protein